jgi:hypothetical protein
VKLPPKTHPCETSAGEPRAKLTTSGYADEAIRSMLNRGDRPGPGRLFVPGQCPLCHFWHVYNLPVAAYDPDEAASAWEVVGCPTGKQVHDTFDKARDHLIGLKKLSATRGPRRRRGGRYRVDAQSMHGARMHQLAGHQLRVYDCDFCGMWHVGHGEGGG